MLGENHGMWFRRMHTAGADWRENLDRIGPRHARQRLEAAEMEESEDEATVPRSVQVRRFLLTIAAAYMISS